MTVATSTGLLDRATLYSSRTARRLSGTLRLWPRVKSDTSPLRFNSYFQIKNNVVVFWENPKPAAASRSTVLGCLS